MKPSYKFYKGCYRLARALIGIFYRIKVYGQEHIPEGAAVVCANHSSVIDPFFIVFAFGIKHHMHILAKAELFRIPVISTILTKLGMIRVERKGLDGATIKNALGYLKKREKVTIFPEGTRVREDGAVAPKSGAVRIAGHAKVPLIPVFIPRKKPLFSTIKVVIGEPFISEEQGKKHDQDEYARITTVLMDKIKALNPHRIQEVGNRA